MLSEKSRLQVWISKFRAQDSHQKRRVHTVEQRKNIFGLLSKSDNYKFYKQNIVWFSAVCLFWAFLVIAVWKSIGTRQASNLFFLHKKFPSLRENIFSMNLNATQTINAIIVYANIRYRNRKFCQNKKRQERNESAWT